METLMSNCFSHIKQNVDNGTPIITNDTVGVPPDQPVEELQFIVNEHICQEIAVGLYEYEQAIKTFEICNLELGHCPSFKNKYWLCSEMESNMDVDINRNWMRKMNVSPDAFLQIGFQITAAILKGHAVCHYEAISLAMFKHGRTETMRPATREIIDCLRIYKKFTSNRHDITVIQKFNMYLRNAMRCHNEVVKNMILSVALNCFVLEAETMYYWLWF